MASWLTCLLSYVWPFKASSDCSVSRKLVDQLPIQPSTKQFTFALRHPENPSCVVYILATVLLSERSSVDARDLIKSLKPESVIAEVGSDALGLIQAEFLRSTDSKELSFIPTSPFHVIKESFSDGNKASRRIPTFPLHVQQDGSNDGHTLTKYLRMAETEVLRAIFGTTYTGHVTAAKKAAAESKSLFYYLEVPNVSKPEEGSIESNSTTDYASKSLAGSWRNLVLSHLKSSIGHPQNYLTATLQDSLTMAFLSLNLPEWPEDLDPNVDMDYACPLFAQPIYPLLVDLHTVYNDLPGISIALKATQNLLRDVETGRNVDFTELSLSQCFRLAVEGLRVSLSVAALAPLKMNRTASSEIDFENLSLEEKSYALLAEALKQQAQQSHTVVAILDTASVAGIRRHWLTPVPEYVSALAKECLISEDDVGIDANGTRRKNKLLDKPIVVVGAGAAAALGVASLSHVGPMSTAVKILTFNIPAVVKLVLMQSKRGAVTAMAKIVAPVVKVMVPSAKGLGISKVISLSKAPALKAATGSMKVKSAAHSVVGTAQRASLNAIRTAFYNVMQTRKRKITAGRPWLGFGVSVAACVGLLSFGDGIESAVEAIPEASSIAYLGRGVKSLCHTSEIIKQTEEDQYWERMYSKLYGLLMRKK